MNQIVEKNVREHPFLSGLNPSEIDVLISKGRVKTLRKGEVLMREGEAAQEFFFILKGTLEVYRQDLNSGQKMVLGSFEPTDLVGELALIDKGTRSANVIAVTDAELFAVPFAAWYAVGEKDSYLHQIFFHLAQNVCQRLRHLNEKALESQIKDLQERFRLGQFFVYLLGFCSFYIYLLESIRFFGLDTFRAYLKIPFVLFFLGGMLTYMRRYQVPLKALGVTTENWKRSVLEGAIFSVPVLIVLSLFKIISQKIGLISVGSFFVNKISMRDLVIYVFFSVPVQEFVVRGGIQGLLSSLLVGPHKDWIAIGISGLLFSVGHLFLSFYLALGVLLVNIYFGWIYARNRTLFSVWIAHSIIGIWGIDVLGL